MTINQMKFYINNKVEIMEETQMEYKNNNMTMLKINQIKYVQ